MTDTKQSEEKKKRDVIPIEPTELEDLFKKHPELKLGPQPSCFDAPCPDSGSVNVEDHSEVQEWVFNHLPLSSEQKKDFLKILLLDKLKAERKEKTEALMKKYKTPKRPKKEVSDERPRTSVKETS